MTDDQLLELPQVTAKDAAAYLGIPEQSCRVLARSGKIGEPILNTNRVMFQPYKMIRFKRGEDENAQMEHLAELLRQTGLTETATKLAVAMVKIAQSEA